MVGFWLVLMLICLIIAKVGYDMRGPRADWTLPTWPKYFLYAAAFCAAMAFMALLDK